MKQNFDIRSERIRIKREFRIMVTDIYPMPFYSCRNTKVVKEVEVGEPTAPVCCDVTEDRSKVEKKVATPSTQVKNTIGDDCSFTGVLLSVLLLGIGYCLFNKERSTCQK